MVEQMFLRIGRFLASEAIAGRRTTYRELAVAIGWHHPTGRGLGSHLWQLLNFTSAENLPCLTAVLVQAGTSAPPSEALAYIREVYGDIDVSDEQTRVFNFDWSRVGHFSFPVVEAPAINFDRIYATRTWGFDPKRWGMTGFSQEWSRDRILAEMGNEPIYVVSFCSQHSEVVDGQTDRYTIAPQDRARVLGISEVQPVKAGHEGHTDPEAIQQMEVDWGGQRWQYGLENSRAWSIVARPWTKEVLPNARSTSWEATVGIVALTTEEKRLLRQYQLNEEPVYGKVQRQVAFALREPMHTTYLAICDNPTVLAKTNAPLGTKLVKIGVSGDTDRRLRDLNEHHFAKIFGVSFSMYATRRWDTQAEALSRETSALEWALDNATEHASGEYFYMTDQQIGEALLKVKPAKRVR